MKSYPVTAHRGLARIYPENTRASVIGALLSGLDKVEIDIQLSADGVPVVLHDPTLDRLCGRSGDVRQWPWARLKKLSVHEPGRFGRRFKSEKLSGLAELAQELAGQPGLKTLFVELKEESLIPFGRERMLEAVAEALRPIHRRCVLISFDLDVLSVARESTRFAVGPVLRSLRQLRGEQYQALHPDWVFCNAKLLPGRGSLKALFGAAKSCVYEVPEAAQARALLKRGITALETFRSDTLAQELTLFR
jgi:glycerophosphoryl diester phosphodiesterase